jgi:hypothetical protein
MGSLPEGYGRKKRRAHFKLAARMVSRMMISGTIDADVWNTHQ